MADNLNPEVNTEVKTPSAAPSYTYSAISEKYGGGNEKAVNDMYDASKASQLAGLEAAFQQNLSDAEAAKAQINPAFQKSANSLATQYERNRRNLNTAASMNGLNTGTASQQQLALNTDYLGNFGALKEQQANQLAEADRGIGNTKAAYQNQVQQAIADNDFNRAQALINEYNNSFSRDMQLRSLAADDAQTRASFGDFSGYEALYGKETADNMKQLWITQNPKLAYQAGVIDKATYNKLTGSGGYYRPETAPEAPEAAGTHYGISDYLTNVNNAKNSGNAAQAMEAINYGVQNGDLSAAQAKVLTDMVNSPTPNVTRGSYANQTGK